MKRLHLVRSLCFAALCFLLLGVSACSRAKKVKKFTIGFSQSNGQGIWRESMLEEMNRELSFHPELNFIYQTAGGDSKKQIAQVRELAGRGIDLLIISSIEAEPLTMVVEEVFRKGIPVVVVDSKINSTAYSAFVGADNYEIGKMAGLYAAHLLKGKGKITEIHGLTTSSPAIERHEGFVAAIKTYPSLQIVDSIEGRWDVNRVNASVERKASTWNADLVFAHNDGMARAAFTALGKSKGRGEVKFLGIDGLPGKEGGMQLVRDKILTATVLYPTGGQEAIQVAARILNGEEYQKEHLLQSTVIDSTNVRMLTLQFEKVLEQQRQIERQHQLLVNQQRIYDSQQTFVYILVSSLILSMFLGGFSFYSWRVNKKINGQLKQQNEAIRLQKDQLGQMSLAAQAANDAKVNFFTKLSHELRTPLTLILTPLEDLKKEIVSTRGSRSLSLIHKNGVRLLKMVNQLMDFRRVEVDKMRLQITENDLIETISEALQSFKEIAQKRGIDLRLICNERKLNAWYDLGLIDKVIFNLLSNAFKFTNDKGYIHLYMSKSEDRKTALLAVEDNGIGMSKEAQERAFELFYQEEFQHDRGSGLGLALSREFIQMHGGTITVHSEKGKGSTFRVALPLGKAHLKPEDLISQDAPLPPNDYQKLYLTELEPEGKVETGSVSTEQKGQKETSILIIEDNADLSRFLQEKLEQDYEVLLANNGTIALQYTFDYVPDLIICDVMIPQKDGLSLTKLFKYDHRTSHIPIILLTAQAGLDKQVEGMKNLADAYITKPFSMPFLEETIRSLLNNRSLLREHFTGDLSSSLKTPVAGKLDRKFLHEFTALIEANLSNEQLSVEEVSKGLGIAKIQLHRKIKALLNTNVSDYIVNTRLTKAKYLLKNEDLSIQEIASKVGFASASYFSTVFKTKVGVSPKDFKKS